MDHRRHRTLSPYKVNLTLDYLASPELMNQTETVIQVTFSQCLSLIPGLQMVVRMGRCCLNRSILLLKLLATRDGPGRLEKVLVSLCIVLHMPSSSSDTFSASKWRKGPGSYEIK